MEDTLRNALANSSLKLILDQLKTLSQKNEREPLQVELHNTPRSSYGLITAACGANLQGFTVIVIAASNAIAEQLLQETSFFYPQGNYYFFPDIDILPYAGAIPDKEITRHRINTLYSLGSDNRGKIIFTTIEALIRKIIPPSYLDHKSIALSKQADYDLQEIIHRLVAMGYHREQMVESLGQFANRGDILDIYPPSFDNPVRLEFFGDNIERISLFDPVSQISIQELESVSFYPKSEIIVTAEEKAIIDQWVKGYCQQHDLNYEQAIAHVNAKHSLDQESGWQDLISLITDAKPFLDWLQGKTLFLVADHDPVFMRMEQVYREYQSLYQEHKKNYPCLPPDQIICNQKELLERLDPCFYLCLVARQKAQHTLLESGIKAAPQYKGQIKKLREELANLLEQKYSIVITSPFLAQLIRIEDMLEPLNPIGLFEDERIDPSIHGSKIKPARKKTKNLSSTKGSKKASKLFLLKSDLREGLEIKNDKILLLTDHDIFGRSYRRKSYFKRRKSDPIKSFLDIKPGDYVVHINHGIGCFQGLKRIKTTGKERDFLVIEYFGNDMLYVPLDQISMVQRYIGSGDGTPRLDNLGKNTWQKVKERVKKNVEELAQELIKIYAARKKMRGYCFASDTIWQEEFEAQFPYEETPDQIQAIYDVKKDMESDRPMDRLVCGDVGFGKTEVAIRATFKAAMAGKQSAFLVPTTVLCMQHYNTLKDRFKEYPITVKMLSRFVSTNETKVVKEELANGAIDIIIGTHALLGKDIKFKNLGLAIIDEEQRFGVKHKERLKQFRTLVDTLTMTATPIPRTLHMSLAKMRDISVINTPPSGRQAVETYIMEDNPEMLTMAIDRELQRGGQVFYIHNRVESIEAAADFIHSLLPNAVLGIAHGQLNKIDLENVMVEFIQGNIDILVCTTIIESGIDIPTANTLIVNRADTFGLSQLYQLKGRVGRSGEKAYAYFFYPADRSLSEIAQKRLQVIHEYADLGSGFMVAMRDLEIRGAGNILGPEQSGDIIEVGFELYMKLLDEAVLEQSGEKIEQLAKPIINIGSDLYIPDSYIADTKQKMEIYKKLEAANSIAELKQVETECQDRFGAPDSNIQILFFHEEIRVLATLLAIESIHDHGKAFRIVPGKKVKIDPLSALKLVTQNPMVQLAGSHNEFLDVYFSQVEVTVDEKRLRRFKNVLQELYDLSFSKISADKGKY